MTESIKQGIKGISQFMGQSADSIIEGGVAFGNKVGVGAEDAAKFIKDAVMPDPAKEAMKFGEKVFPTEKVEPEAPDAPEPPPSTPEEPPAELPLRKLMTESAAPDREVIRKIQKRSEEEVPDFSMDDTEDFERQEDKDRQEILSGLEYIQAQINGKGSGMVSKAGAVQRYHKELMSWENPNESGLQGDKFMPFKSIEGRGSDPDNSEYEIGYGIKIRQSWISDNRKDWPVINGVHTDIRDGISRELAEQWCYEMQNQAYSSAKEQINTSSWDKMVEPERTFWTDLVYNGGPKSIDANTKAKAAMDKGYSVEAMLKCLNYINASGKPMRGLLNRRISRYNSAALDMPGVPTIESYTVKGEEVELKFASSFSSPKVSDKYKEHLNSGNSMTLKVKAGMKKGEYKSERDFSFRK